MELKTKKLILDLTIAALVISIALVICAFLARKPLLCRFKSIAIQDYLKVAQTGDIIIFADNLPQIRWTVLTPWTHVGIVIKDDIGLCSYPTDSKRSSYGQICEADASKICLYESNMQESTNFVDGITGEKKMHGPQVIGLLEKLSSYSGSFFVRRLEKLGQVANDMVNSKRMQDLKPVVEEFKNYGFDFTAKFWVSRFMRFRGFPLPIPLPTEEAEKRKAIICSELVAHCLEKMGALKTGLNKSQFLPRHFMGSQSKQYLQNGWALSEPYRLT